NATFERTSIDAFVQRLRELSWIENRTVAIEYRWAEGREERFAEIAAEFVRLKVDVILTYATPSSIAAKKASGHSHRVCRRWRPGRHGPCGFTRATGGSCGWSRIGSRNRASSIPGQMHASPSDTRGGSRMLELGTYGSERGARGNSRPYRDHQLSHQVALAVV